MKKKRFIPYSWLPSSWGLSGSLYEEQKARYYYDGYDLDEQLININYSGKEHSVKMFDLKLAYGLISEYDADSGKATLIEDETERKIAMFEADRKAGKITDTVAEKEIATLKKEPWIKIVNDGLAPDKGVDGYYFEFDWNKYWVEKLLEEGYSGKTDEEIIDMWFRDVCRHEAGIYLDGDDIIDGGIR